MSHPRNRRGGCVVHGEPLGVSALTIEVDDFEVVEICKNCLLDAAIGVGAVRATDHYPVLRRAEQENRTLLARARQAEAKYATAARERRKVEDKYEALREALAPQAT